MTHSQPNLLVVFTDQQRWDTAGCCGNPMDLTANLDAMAARGTHFERAFTCQPVCGPARASLQTGLYAAATGVWRNGLALPGGLATLAGCLGDAGYETGYIGKWHLAGTRAEPVPLGRRGGYDFWLAADVPEFTSYPYEGTFFDGDSRPVRFAGQYRVDWLTDRAAEFLRRGRERPFFLFLSLLEPHQQNEWNRFVAPDGYADRFRDCWVPEDLRGREGDWPEQLPDYYGMVRRIDECLGRLLEALDAQGVADETIVIFTSDHGCHFRTRNREYKRSCHESSIRIPLVADGPGFRGGGKIDALVSLVDLPPTLLSACGVGVPEQMHGRSAMPLVAGQAADWPDEVFVQISESHTGRAVRDERWKYCVTAADGAVRDGGAAADRYVDCHLYDLQADPHERTNLIGRTEHADVVERMRARLVERMVAAGEDAPTIGPAPT